ncbi:sensor histidine kinase [Streptomyces sp. NPDC102490]|uniref:sensor histidine kinase n=1 Tax=Streptomyces sp. NPDC102490 TaxID=3366183 RepID=UPI0038078F8C
MRVRSGGQESGGTGAPRPSVRVRRGLGGAAYRVRRGLGGASRRVRREAVAGWAAVRGAGRRTVVVEGVLLLLTAAFGLVPLVLVVPARPGLAVAEALWAVLLVALRRGRPVAAVLGAAPLVVGVNVWTLAVAPLVVMSATRRIAPTRRAWQVVGAASAVVGVLTVVTAPFRTERLAFQVVGNAVSLVLLLVLPALAGTLLGQRRPLVSLLRERNAYLERARALTAEAARAEERNRIAGEMHDLLGHRLSLISVHAGALELAAARQAPALAGQTELLRTTAGTAMEELREILGVLRHADLAGPGEDRSGDGRGTREDIAALVDESRRTGGAVELDWSVPEGEELGPRTRQAIHRVVREGLTNVLKHASGAPTWVQVRSVGGGIEVSVTNAPPPVAGPSRGGTHSGLAGCAERVGLLGGTFEAGALVNGGFRVAARLPAAGRSAAGHPPAGHSSPGRPSSPRSSSPQPLVRPGPGGARAPLPDEILTWPRVLGSGCAALVVVLPTAGFLVVLLVLAVLG